MGVSVQVEHQFSHDNIDENANDQSKHQLDPEIGTEKKLLIKLPLILLFSNYDRGQSF